MDENEQQEVHLSTLGSFQGSDLFLFENSSLYLEDVSSLFDDSSGHVSASQTESSSVASPKKVRRKTNPESLLLSNFTRIGASAPPKKEYLRIKLIRAFKRALRQVDDEAIPLTKIHRCDLGDRNSRRKWKCFRTFVKNHPDLIPLSPTFLGPHTDGQSKRPKNDPGKFRCHSDKYCREFFASAEVQEAYCLFLDIIFVTTGESSLEAKFEFRATAEDPGERATQWRRLKEYLYSGMFDALGVRRVAAR